MGIAERMNKEFETTAQFASELSTGVQEEILPQQEQIQELAARLTTLETTIASLISAQPNQLVRHNF